MVVLEFTSRSLSALSEMPLIEDAQTTVHK